MSDKNTLIKMQRDIMIGLAYDCRSMSGKHPHPTRRQAKQNIAEIHGMIDEAIKAYDILGREINNVEREHREQEARLLKAAETPVDA